MKLIITAFIAAVLSACSAPKPPEIHGKLEPINKEPKVTHYVAKETIVLHSPATIKIGSQPCEKHYY